MNTTQVAATDRADAPAVCRESMTAGSPQVRERLLALARMAEGLPAPDGIYLSNTPNAKSSMRSVRWCGAAVPGGCSPTISPHGRQSTLSGRGWRGDGT
jgi:hypothetical protein